MHRVQSSQIQTVEVRYSLQNCGILQFYAKYSKFVKLFKIHPSNLIKTINYLQQILDYFMINTQFSVSNGEINFETSDNHPQNVQMPFQLQIGIKNLSDETNVESLSIMGINQRCDLNDQSSSQLLTDSTAIRKEKNSNRKNKKRNTQNSIRTINRKIRPFIKRKYKVFIQTFYTSNEPLHLLALFRKQKQTSGISEVQKYLQKQFFQLINSQNPKELKDIKLKAVLKFFIGLREKDLQQASLKQTMLKLSVTGQLKYHPPKAQKLNPEFLFEIEQKILPL